MVAAVGVALWGLGFGALPVSIQSYITRAAPEEAESGGALLLTTLQVAIASGAVLGGVLVEYQGLLGVIAFVGIMTLVGALAMIALGGKQEQLG